MPLDGHSLYSTQAMAAPPLSTQRSFHAQQQQQHNHRNISRVGGSNIQFQQQSELSGLQFDNLQPSLYPYNLNEPPSSFPSAQQQQQQSQRIPTAFSPTLGFSPSSFFSEALATTTAPTPPSNFQYATFPFDASHGTTTTQAKISGISAQTPSGQSQTSDSHSHTTISENGPPSEKDPFLSLLEQLAENEHAEGDGPSELDYLLSAGIHASSNNEDATSDTGDGMASAGREALDSTGQALDHGIDNGRP
jgi:hypothetical protein